MIYVMQLSLLIDIFHIQSLIKNQSVGKLILIDPISNQTVGAAMINHSMRRASNIHKHDLAITREI